MSEHNDHGNDGHHILSDNVSLNVLIFLLVFTVITVAAARVDLGVLNFPLAMLIGSVKALMVCLFFMGLKYDDRDNRVIFFSSLFFLGVFIALTGADIFSRGAGWRAEGPLLAEAPAAGEASKYKKAWVASDELKARGKELYAQNCVICHGAEGKGDGPASAALNPKPRNFTAGEGWKNGRKVSDVFTTLTKGLNTMPAYAQLPNDDRWALVHHVLSLGPKPPEASNDDLKKAGVLDPNRDDGGVAAAERKLPIDFAIDRYVNSSKK